VRVRDPYGDSWSVRRRWWPWRRRLRVPDDYPDIGLDLGGDDPISAVLSVIALIILIPALIILALALAEVLLLLLLVPLAVLIRVIRRGAWPVEVRGPGRFRLTQPVVGFRASGERAAVLAEAIRRGAFGRRGSPGTGRHAR
jgi:hypothetical protein